jgi:hypothetical protein
MYRDGESITIIIEAPGNPASGNEESFQCRRRVNRVEIRHQCPKVGCGVVAFRKDDEPHMRCNLRCVHVGDLNQSYRLLECAAAIASIHGIGSGTALFNVQPYWNVAAGVMPLPIRIRFKIGHHLQIEDLGDVVAVYTVQGIRNHVYAVSLEAAVAEALIEEPQQIVQCANHYLVTFATQIVDGLYQRVQNIGASRVFWDSGNLISTTKLAYLQTQDQVQLHQPSLRMTVFAPPAAR